MRPSIKRRLGHVSRVFLRWFHIAFKSFCVAATISLFTVTLGVIMGVLVVYLEINYYRNLNRRVKE